MSDSTNNSKGEEILNLLTIFIFISVLSFFDKKILYFIEDKKKTK
jgi:hypothetical protein